MWWPCSIITGGRSRCSGQRVPLVIPMGRLETGTSMRRAWSCMSPPQPRAPHTSVMLPCLAEAVSGTIRFVWHICVIQTSQFLWMGSLWLKKQPPAQRRHVIGRLKCFNHTAGFSFDPVALIKCEIAETELRMCVLISSSITQTLSEHFCWKWCIFLTLFLSSLIHRICRCVTVKLRLGGTRPAWLWWTHSWMSCRVDASTLSSSLRVCSRRPPTVLWVQHTAHYNADEEECDVCSLPWFWSAPLSFVKVSMEDACDSSTSLGTYSLLLHSYIGRTMLEFQVKHGVCFTESCSFFWPWVTESVTRVTKKVHLVIHKISSVAQHLKCFKQFNQDQSSLLYLWLLTCHFTLTRTQRERCY